MDLKTRLTGKLHIIKKSAKTLKEKIVIKEVATTKILKAMLKVSAS